MDADPKTLELDKDANRRSMQRLVRLLEADLAAMTPEELNCPAHKPTTVRQVVAMATVYAVMGSIILGKLNNQAEPPTAGGEPNL